MTINRSLAAICAIAVGAGIVTVDRVSAQEPAATATLAGKVAASDDPVRAFRVQARDTVNRITYTVYTNRSRYEIFNLPPSTYEVSVLEDGFVSPLQNIELQSGDTKTVDVALTAAPDTSSQSELRDFDELYPPDPARDLMVEKCFGCHQIQQQWHLMGGKTVAEWREGISRMWDVERHNERRLVGWIKNPPMMEYPLTDEQTDMLAEYLATHFPPGHANVNWKTDQLVRDETALTQAIFIQWDLPPAEGPEFSDPHMRSVSRITHDPFPSTVQPGAVWLAGLGNSSFLSVNTHDLNYATRAKEWRIPHPDNINVGSHGIIELNGKAYTVGVGDDALNELDPKTGEFQRWAAPRPGAGAHTLRADSEGNIWFTTVYGGARVNRWDAETKTVREYNPIEGANWYGVDVDQKDRVWVASYTTFNIAMYDPMTAEWTIYPTSGAHRRLGVDLNGKVWAGQYFGNILDKIDPDTTKVTAYTLPLKYGNPYEAWPDLDGNVWMDVTMYNSLVRFQPGSETFTYFPFPVARGHAPKVEVDADNTLWFGLRGTLTAFKSHGNIPMVPRAE